MHERAGREVPDYYPPQEWQYLIGHYWELRRFDVPITPGLVIDWMRCQGLELSRRERNLIYELDFAMRSEMSKKQAMVQRHFARQH